jgi:hypothetical protein
VDERQLRDLLELAQRIVCDVTGEDPHRHTGAGELALDRHG